VRPFVNLPLTKNTTDIALAVDAMELACQMPAPRLIVIGSGDADFVPLVVRLRERGIRMVCVSERSKMAREAVSAYDRVILVGPNLLAQEVQTEASRVPARKTTARKTAAKKAPAAKAPSVKTTRKKTTGEKAVNESGMPERIAVIEKTETTAMELASNVLPALDVAAILLAVPSLQTGQPQPLGAVAKALLDARLRGKNMTATKLLKKFPGHFVLHPLKSPERYSTFPSRISLEPDCRQRDTA
jgi:hypothetical protein